MLMFLDTKRYTPCVGCNNPDGTILPYPQVEGFATPVASQQLIFMMIVFIVLVYIAVVYAISVHKTMPQPVQSR